MDLRTINGNIKRIARNSSALNLLIQETAVGIIVHAAAHGDCSAALRLVQAMPKSQRRGLLINWFARYSPIAINVAGGKTYLHRPEAKTYNAFNVDGARANNWFEGAEADQENLPDTTCEKVVNSLYAFVKRTQKAVDEGQVPENETEKVTALITAVKELARRAA